MSSSTSDPPRIKLLKECISNVKLAFTMKKRKPVPKDLLVKVVNRSVALVLSHPDPANTQAIKDFCLELAQLEERGGDGEMVSVLADEGNATMSAEGGRGFNCF